MLRHRVVRLLLSLSIVVAAGFAAAEDAPPQLAWDQKKVTELAHQLATEVRAVRDAARADPAMGQVGQMQNRAFGRFMETLGNLDRATRQLAKDLADGKGHDATLGTVRRIDMLLRDADERGRSLDISKPLRDHIDPARALIAQLTPYYAPAPKDEKQAEDAAAK